MAHTFSPSTQADLCGIKACLVYIWSSRPDRVTRRSCLKNKKTTKTHLKSLFNIELPMPRTYLTQVSRDEMQDSRLYYTGDKSRHLYHQGDRKNGSLPISASIKLILILLKHKLSCFSHTRL